jgi:hypothetical protein
MSTTPFYTWSSNLGARIRVSVSDHGNIVEFKSPNLPNSQYEHIGVGAYSEGYVLCYTDGGGTTDNVYDLGGSESGFGRATTSRAPVAVTRSTLDGAMRLRQQFNFPPPEQKALEITMRVTNTSGSPLTNVILARQVDLDIDTGGAQGWSNFVHYHGRTSEAVFAWNDVTEAPAGRTAHAMLLRGIKPLPVGVTPPRTKITTNILDPSCSPASLAPTVNGDYGDRLEYSLGNFNPGTSKTVTVQYMRY